MAKGIVNIWSTRRAYFLEYGCGIVLFALLFIAFQKGLGLHPYINYTVVGLGLIAAGSAEYTRFFGDRYKLGNEKLVMINGLINVKKKNVYYHPLAFVPDMNVHQSAWQRALGYGTISVTVSGEMFQLKNVANPNHVLDLLENKIKDSLKKEKKEDIIEGEKLKEKLHPHKKA